MLISTSAVYEIIVQYGDDDPQTHKFKWTGDVRFNEALGCEEFRFVCICGKCPKNDKSFVLTADGLATISDGRITHVDVH